MVEFDIKIILLLPAKIEELLIIGAECDQDIIAEGMTSCPNCGAKIPDEYGPTTQITVSQKIGKAEGTVTGVDMRHQIINYY